MTAGRKPMALTLAALACLTAQVLVAQSAQRSKPEDAGLSSEKLNRLSAELDGYVSAGKLAGGVLLIGRRGHVGFVQAFGQRDVESRSPMREDTLFRIASQTKALVSTVTMMLQEDGRLLITDPVWITIRPTGSTRRSRWSWCT